MKSCQKACSLGSSLSSRESALKQLHNPQHKISISSSASFPLYILQNQCFGPSHVMHPKSPIQDSTFCRLVLPLKWSAFSLPFPAFVYLLTSVSFHSFIFYKVFLPSFSSLNCSPFWTALCSPAYPQRHWTAFDLPALWKLISTLSIFVF